MTASTTSGQFVGPPGDLVSLLDAAAARHGGRPALRATDASFTWAELSRATQGTADALTALGAAPGVRILLALPAGAAFVRTLFGALRTGATVIPTHGAISVYEAQWLLTDARPALVVTDRVDIGAAATVAGITSVTSDEVAGACPVGAAPRSPRPPVTPDSIALLLYTSGSTGRPKGIVCPHRAMAFAVHAIVGRLGYGSRDVVWNRLPLSFDYGLYQVFLCAAAGAELVLPAAEASARELALVREAGATVVPVVPTLAGLLSRLAARDPRPTSVRLVTNTGAALVGADAHRLRTAFPGTALVCMYGMSECKRITVAEPDEDLQHPGTVGRALPGTRLFVVDDRGVRLPPGRTGEIVSAGPHVMAGYWEAPQETARRFRTAPDGCGNAVFTGDRGYLDEAGRLYFVGRADDLFKRRGWRVSTQELEAAMLDVPGVRASAAVPPAEDGVLTVWAVTKRPAREVLQALADRLGPARTPDRCLVVESLPQTSNGKVDKAALRASLKDVP
ncbi:class I adenylate-forming enzyme family protein [Streptomyces sp. TG1A-8]|uniref:class I adenylate-forming enzyme family protein n=1 Tax=Streptomyces sp. TG1A-8 TaxID=3051385 RepID=UPI00265C64CA|nr:class I adenylate-forming enzyme family protein [Streptomyces sp. TG1A-8]MDO0925023.1 class I adenylate-forming enzyme family protein [Streptomyces sp. TG1A-8]